MGIWTWLNRWEQETFMEHQRRGEFRLRGGLDASSSGRQPASQPKPTEEIHTDRIWHALHVALTGQEVGGSPPAAYVLWTSHDAPAVTFSAAEFFHPPSLVREVADWLRYVDYDRAVADLYAAIDLGMYVYSFDNWRGDQDMVQSGGLRRVFDEVVRFYARAAEAGQLISVDRG